MRTFHAQIVTPEGMMLDAQVQRIILRTVSGDVGILYGHADYVTIIKNGKIRVLIDGNERTAVCKTGMVTVTKEQTRIVANEFKWIEEG